jgi:hypothetical protein
MEWLCCAVDCHAIARFAGSRLNRRSPRQTVGASLSGVDLPLKLGPHDDRKEISDAAVLARGLVYGNPLIDQIRARGGVDPDQVVDALAQALRVEFGADPGRMTLQAIVFSAQALITCHLFAGTF